MSILSRVRRRIVCGALTASVILINCGHLQAAYLHWVGTFVQTSSVDTCFRFANSTLKRKGYTSIKRSATEVNGGKNGAFVVIACIGTRNVPR
jgi:hypothetical protein